MRMTGALALAFLSASGTATAADDATLARGRYLAVVAGCNDCHTAGFTTHGGKVPETAWFKGDTLGYAGPWGTTYAPNLRLTIARMDLPAWTAWARSVVLRPPMPYWSLNAMSDADLAALWHFTRSLGEPGPPAPTALPPGEEPPLPVFRLVMPAMPPGAPD